MFLINSLKLYHHSLFFSDCVGWWHHTKCHFWSSYMKDEEKKWQLAQKKEMRYNFLDNDFSSLKLSHIHSYQFLCSACHCCNRLSFSSLKVLLRYVKCDEKVFHFRLQLITPKWQFLFFFVLCHDFCCFHAMPFIVHIYVCVLYVSQK